MKKLIYIILFLFCLLIITSCKTKESDLFLAIGKVDEIQLFEKRAVLNLKLLSNKQKDEIFVVGTSASVPFDYHIEECIDQKEVLNKIGYTYMIKIILYQEAVINTITIKTSNKEYEFNIGNYKCIKNTNSEHINLTVLDDYINETNLVQKIFITNTSKRIIAIKDLKIKTASSNITVNLLKKIDTPKAMSDQKCFEYATCYVNNNSNLHTITYIISIDYIYANTLYTSDFVINSNSVASNTFTDEEIVWA